MPVKYHCPKCGRRFVDWGAEKLGFKCPDCDDAELVRAGAAEERPGKRPSLKRSGKRAAPVERVVVEEEEYVGLAAEDAEPAEETEEEVPVDEIGEEEAFVAVEEEEAPGFSRSPAELIPGEPDEDEVDLDMPEDLNFGDVAPPLVDEPFEETDENWHE